MPSESNPLMVTMSIPVSPYALFRYFGQNAFSSAFYFEFDPEVFAESLSKQDPELAECYRAVRHAEKVSSELTKEAYRKAGEKYNEERGDDYWDSFCQTSWGWAEWYVGQYVQGDPDLLQRMHENHKARCEAIRSARQRLIEVYGVPADFRL